MKKLRMLVILIILAFSFSVKAEVLLELDCNGNEITNEKSVTCEGWLYYENEGISDIEISFNTNLDINFNLQDDYTGSIDGNKISIHSKTMLYDEIGFSTKIFELTLSINDMCGEKEKISLGNIMINKDSTIEVEDVSKEFNVSIPHKEPVIEKVIPKEEYKPSTICTLESITIDNKLVTNFNKDNYEYKDINVKANNETVYINAIRTSDLSSASGLGGVPVSNGETIKRDIVVIAEDGTKCVYNLYITNTNPKISPTPANNEEVIIPDENIVIKSNDNTLKDLEVYSNNKKLDFKFDKTKDTFDIEVSVNKVTIKATLNDTKASFDNVFKPRDITLDLIDNEEIIKVIAENGNEKVYKLNIHVNTKNGDNTLSSLKINDIDINLEDEKLEIIVPNDVVKSKIEAIANNEKATIKYEDVELKVGDNLVKIVVTSEDGNTKEYEVNVIRLDNKTLFERIEITGYDINFSKDKKIYNLKVENDTKELDIKVIPNNIDFEVLNNKNIQNGSKIIIKATDDNGVYEYTINISKEDNKLNIICYGVFGIGVISLIASIIIFIKKKKCKQIVKIV